MISVKTLLSPLSLSLSSRIQMIRTAVPQEGETASFKTVKKYVYLSLIYNASSPFSKLYIYLCFEMLNKKGARTSYYKKLKTYVFNFP
jgi:hypothetical protein